MCLILFAHGVHPAWPLVVAANRDEFHARPAAPAGWWAERRGVLAGRDLEAGGTWLGLGASGRFAAVTNFTEAPPEPVPPRSRGDLVADFLAGDVPPEVYLHAVASEGQAYRGFNLLVGNARELWYFSNRAGAPVRLDPGIYGLSNHLLDTAWPKVRRGKSALASFTEAEARADVPALLELLGDDTQPDDAELAAAGLEPEAARRVAPCFIRGDVYGTRASTVVLLAADRARFSERRFGPGGRHEGDRHFEIDLGPQEALSRT